MSRRGSNYLETSFRVEKLTFRSVKKLVRKLESHNLIKSFAEDSIRSYAQKLLSKAAGGETLVELVDLLGDVEGFQENELEANLHARVGKGDLKKTITVELDIKTLRVVGDIADHTGSDNSTVFRMCLFQRLFRIADNPETPIEFDFNAGLFIFAWAEIENGLNTVRSQFHELLHRRFSLQTDATQHIIERDLQRFERFAEAYQKKLHGTRYLEELRNEYGDRAFTDTANLIGEVTSIHLEPDDSGFLEDVDVT